MGRQQVCRFDFFPPQSPAYRLSGMLPSAWWTVAIERIPTKSTSPRKIPNQARRPASLPCSPAKSRCPSSTQASTGRRIPRSLLDVLLPQLLSRLRVKQTCECVDLVAEGGKLELQVSSPTKLTCAHSLGPGQHTQYSLIPLPQLSHSIVAVALGQDHTLALTSAGEVLSWGLSRFHQLGYVVEPSTTTGRLEEPIQASPRKIFGPLKKEVVKGVAASKQSSACWTATEVFTWGTNNGQLGVLTAYNLLSFSHLFRVR